jgi:AcrR family transcriptional regulator
VIDLSEEETVAAAVEGDTREALLDAAQALFAAEGIDGVSLAAITRFAGQRNGGAIHYYFGGRDGLLAAILAAGEHRQLAQHRLFVGVEKPVASVHHRL